MLPNIGSVIQAWKELNLPQLQKELDEVAVDLASRQDSSDQSRKKLVELSREFKRNTEEEVRKVVAPLLRQFQVEIDDLSKRSKAAESAFLDVYNKLVDAPNLVPVLDYCETTQQKITKLHDLEIENKQLRDTLKDYNQEFKEVKNQELVIRQLREEVRELTDTADDTVEAKVKEIQKDMERQYSDKLKFLTESNETLTSKLGSAQERVQELQRLLENSQSELFEMKNRYDTATQVKLDEMDIVMNDFERVNQRAAIAEREVTQLKERINELLTNPAEAMENVERTGNPTLEWELAAKEREITQLMSDLQLTQTSATKLKETSTAEIQQLQQRLGVAEQELAAARQRLDVQWDYDEIQRELSILKAVEFSGLRMSKESQGFGKDEGEKKPVEVLLVEKARILQSENTVLKVSNTELQVRYDAMVHDYNEATKTIHRQKELIERLEEDLSNVNALPLKFRGEGEGRASSTPIPALASADFIADIINERGSPEQVSNAESLLPIISSQRERLRQRVDDLETQNSQQRQQLQRAQLETEKLRNDNLQLYEKIRFLQAYPGARKSPRNADDMEQQYLQKYEEHMNPFSSFSKKEKLRRYQNLSPFEKVTLGLGRTILTSRIARTVTVLYGLFLHLLVFMVLYKLAYTETCLRETALSCAERFAQHMQEIHGQTMNGMPPGNG